jgi:uncharacterized low-complexity protein
MIYKESKSKTTGLYLLGAVGLLALVFSVATYQSASAVTYSTSQSTTTKTVCSNGSCVTTTCINGQCTQTTSASGSSIVVNKCINGVCTSCVNGVCTPIRTTTTTR